MCVQTFYGLGPQSLLRTGLRAACGKITISDIPNCLKYCVIFKVYTQFTNVDAGRITQPGGPRDGDPNRNLHNYCPHSNILTFMYTTNFTALR